MRHCIRMARLVSPAARTSAFYLAWLLERIRDTRERINRRFTGSFLWGRIFADLSDDLAANSIDYPERICRNFV
jgi:hypothetical protein